MAARVRFALNDRPDGSRDHLLVDPFGDERI
jgi:hypothetical protein